MAGYFSHGICFASQQDATDTHFQNIQPFYVSELDVTYQYSYVQESESWYLQKSEFMPSGTKNVLFSTLQEVDFNSCENTNDPTSNFMDGLELGWSVSTAIVLAVVIRRMYRGS